MLESPIIESVVTPSEPQHEILLNAAGMSPLTSPKLVTFLCKCGKQGGTAKYIPRPYMGTGYFYFPCEYFYYLGGIDHD